MEGLLFGTLFQGSSGGVAFRRSVGKSLGRLNGGLRQKECNNLEKKRNKPMWNRKEQSWKSSSHLATEARNIVSETS